MIGIGATELVVIGVVVILFIKPADLPSLFRKAGRAWGKIKKTMDEITEIRNEFIKQVDAVAKMKDPEASVGEKSTVNEKAKIAETVSGNTESLSATPGGVDHTKPESSALPPAKQENATQAGESSSLASFDAADPASSREYTDHN